MLGLFTLAIVQTGSFRIDCRAASVSGGAVAVSAITGTPGS